MQYIKNSDNSRTFTPETQDEIDALDYVDSTLGYSGLPRIVGDFVKQRQQQKLADSINALHNQIAMLSNADRDAILTNINQTVTDNLVTIANRTSPPTPVPITPMTETP